MLEAVPVTRVRLRATGRVRAMRFAGNFLPETWGMQVSMRGAAKDDAGEPVRLGVIGVGVMGSNQARVLADISGV